MNTMDGEKTKTTTLRKILTKAILFIGKIFAVIKTITNERFIDTINSIGTSKLTIRTISCFCIVCKQCKQFVSGVN